MKKFFILSAALLVLFAVTPATAAGIKYFEDPVYKKLDPEDHLPMEDMLMLANDGDVRAQYILGDLYSKGKGGFAKDLSKSREWFETSARNGYAFSFIRLAALAKHQHAWVEAYQWYTLAVERCDGANRAWAQKAREALAADAKLTPEEISRAKEGDRAWQKAAIEKNRAEREARIEHEKNLIGPKLPSKATTTVKTQTTTVKQYRNGDN